MVYCQLHIVGDWGINVCILGLSKQDLYSFKENSLPYEIPKFGLNQADIEQDTA